jgi:hypothetical protein
MTPGLPRPLDLRLQWKCDHRPAYTNLAEAFNYAGWELTSVKDQAGRSPNSHGANGKVATITDPAGLFHGYDAAVEPDDKDHLGNTIIQVRYFQPPLATYDTRGNMIYSMLYDSQGRLYYYVDKGGPDRFPLQQGDADQRSLKPDTYYYNDAGHMTAKRPLGYSFTTT